MSEENVLFQLTEEDVYNVASDMGVSNEAIKKVMKDFEMGDGNIINWYDIIANMLLKADN